MKCSDPPSSGKMQKLLLLALQIILFISLTVFCPKEGLAASRDLIVVIDKSVSMLDEFDSVRSAAKNFAASAQVGDRVTVITFGSSTHLLERRHIKSPQDMASILSAIDGVEPTDFATNLGAGMERSLGELTRLYDENASNERVVLWLSDGKNNPPPDIENLITFVSLKEREAKRLPEKEWFAFQSPIRHEQSDVEWFVEWANRKEMPLKVHITGGDSEQIIPPLVERGVKVQFEPETRAAQGASFSVTAEIADMEGTARYESAPVEPQKITCHATAWEEALRIEFPAKPGKYLCRISFVLPSDQTLKINPLQVNVKGTVLPRIETVKQLPNTTTASLADVTGGVAGMPGSKDHMSVVSGGPSASHELVAFGPILPGNEYSRHIDLASLRAVNNPKSLSIITNFQLPEGLTLHPVFSASGNGVSAELTLVASKGLQLSSKWEQHGIVHFVSEGGQILPAGVPVRIFAADNMAGGARKALMEHYVVGWTRNLVSIVKDNFMMAAKFLLIFSGLCVLSFLTKRFIFGGAGLTGHLEVLENPTGKTMKPIKLRRIGRLKGRSFLTVGGDKKADIALHDESVAEMHARISTARTPAGTLLFLQPLSSRPVLVNGAPCVRAKELGNGDVITIGNYKFAYRCPQSFKEIVLCFRDGRSIRGMLVSWDIESPLFEFLPKGAPSLEASMTVEFSELKWLNFIASKKKMSSRLRKESAPAGRPAEIIFKDGDVMEGYAIGDWAESNDRFYLVPRNHSDHTLYMVERAAVQNVFFHELEKPQGEILKNLSARIGLQKN